MACFLFSRWCDRGGMECQAAQWRTSGDWHVGLSHPVRRRHVTLINLFLRILMNI